MAKMEITRKIEQYLVRDYMPTIIGGIRLNKMRPSFVGLEVPVECGSVRNGLVDAVRVDECFLSEKDIFRCNFCDAKPEYIDAYSKLVKCPFSEQEQYAACQNHNCRMLRKGRKGTAGILLTAFEIKVSVADFHSNHGHNFCGNCNFYVVPNEIYSQIKDSVPEQVGILVFYDGNQVKTTSKPGTFQYYGLRKKKDCIYQELSDTDQLWLLLSTMKRVVKTYRENQEMEGWAPTSGVF